ncbi:class I adenylate-forming enzyme family protein [Catellatospora citrea]|uniref:Long-chain-fatty-acid--CoA ligase n=1 Tax=Catellatospora citrea TaxID=53366 RepID=A0A8J3KGD3_9ACTN|nr:AMP-binding protein [Catellatospora citrea]RKE09671.1 acyl-CoA synthetase (AMP-forming)/AMP-acid ligase II [Catellatospora citrea]GIG02712.1 long-chain-fatty-acid--CoA ligase [Catellatospora citrea]
MGWRDKRSNAADHLLDTGRADDVAVVDGAQRYTYRDLRGAVARLIEALGELDLPRGSHVAVLGPNSFFWIAGYLAAMKAGCVAVPVSDRATLEEVRRNLALVGAAAAFVDRRALRRFDAALEGIAPVTDEALTSAGRLDEAWPELPAATECDLDADAALMFTSGTTSQPKAVRVTHRNILANTDSIVGYLGLGAEDRVLVVLPFYYCYGASLLHTHLRVGGRVVLLNSFAFPEVALDLLEREQCTVLAGVPSTFQLLLRAASFTARELPSLRVVQQAGGKLAPVLVEELLEARNTARLFLMYGQTEATARLSYLPPELLRSKPDSIGRGIAGVELHVLDEAGDPVRPGEQGEIYARGESICPGYYGAPAESAAKFTPSGLRTGDLATIDEDGDVFIVDRRDDFIKTWGFRVSSQEIEDCALRLDRLTSAAAVGVPDLAAGEAVILFVVARPGAEVTPDEVLAVCRAHLAKHMVPAGVFVVDALPLTGNGKVAKARLVTAAAGGTPTA